MTTPNQLIVLLKDGPSTTDAAASRVGIPTLVAEAMLNRLAKEGLAETVPAGEIQLWKLTPSGWEAAIALKNHAA
jgi:Mn-dependent DtxR family transcriptional regulator